MYKSRSSQKKKKTKKRLKSKSEKPKKRKTKKRLKAKHEKPKKRKQKKKQKSQDPKTLRDIRIPVEPKIPQCQVCEEKKADFYCSIDKVHYCQNCESEVHTSFLKKKHKEFIFQEPYDPRKEINSNLCDKHNKELCLYCKDENELICGDCYDTFEIISNTKFTKIINKNEAKQDEIKETKSQIKILTKLEKDNKTIKLIQESKRMIEKDEEEREIRRSKEEYKEEFDTKMNSQNRIELKNENKTAWNPSSEEYGCICGKKIYSRGKHEIKIKIDQFPNPENEKNVICLGVIKTENRENLIENDDWEGTYYFRTFWDEWTENQSQKVKNENGKFKKKIYPEEIYLKKNDIFTIFLDMDQKKISFKINEKKLKGWENLPEKVNFFALMSCQEGKEKNQINILTKLEKDKKTIKLIRESKEIIEKDEEESGKERKREQEKEEWDSDEKEEGSEEILKEEGSEEETEEYYDDSEIDSEEEIQRSKEEYKEEFDPKMNWENLIELKNENKTAWNLSSVNYGIICGKKIYSRGKYQIKIKIDQFPKTESEKNWIHLGVIKTENRKKLIKYDDYEGIYYFKNFWLRRGKNESYKVKIKTENGKGILEPYPEEIYLKKNDILTIFLDMDQKKISFKLNEKELEGWENLPQKVNFCVMMKKQEGKEKNQITII
ncbi:hypothetical protein M0813_14625 [Anaeramoeba flamelloides]|uniref:B box-type domain-containing protein n=1 Tax=Anaeramoeba flamelloides TaxID=1746091 RepID=A0ABQ8Z5A9_9EUKA|nr:hypothetical protein M0813_14625 [Anaeramoeba flamelloides]